LLDKAAVLVCRLTWNHRLPDGNKRAAWAALAMFLDLNDVHCTPDQPQVDETAALTPVRQADARADPRRCRAGRVTATVSRTTLSGVIRPPL